MIEWKQGNAYNAAVLGLGQIDRVSSPHWEKSINQDGVEIKMSAQLNLAWINDVLKLSIKWDLSATKTADYSVTTMARSGLVWGTDINHLTNDVWEFHMLPAIKHCENGLKR